MDECGAVSADVDATDIVANALAEHPAGERLVVARGVFAGPSPQVSDDLYATVAGGGVRRERWALHLERGASVSTDAYFGLFPASYFQRWTTVAEVQLTVGVCATGAARVRLRGSDSHGHTRTIADTAVEGATTLTLAARLDEFVDGGSLWMDATAAGGPLSITDVMWTVVSPASIRAAALAVCTFNRPRECAHTVAAIANDPGVLAGIDAVYVVDQGTDYVSEQPVFGDAAAILGDKLVYLRQPNLGGSGGFTRALYEVSKITDHANVVLMDDDIVCEPETVLRLNAFANLTPTPTIVGAQMLFARNTRFLLAGAEAPDLARLRPGRWTATALHHSDVVEHRQDKRADAVYSGWWTCLIPAEVVAAVGLPFPMFIKWDDIEYSLRAGAAGFPTVTLPHAGVWHAEFHWKDVDDWTHYFQIRNALITASLHGSLNTTAASRALRREIVECLASMRYGLAHTVIRAVEDFLHGPSILADGGVGAAARIRAERTAFPETILRPAVDIGELTNALPTISTTQHAPRKDRMNLVLIKRLINQWRGRTLPGVVTIPASENYWWHVSLFERAVVTDASQAGVRVRRRDQESLITVARHAMRTLRQFHRQAPAAQHRYQQAAAELCGRQNWARLFTPG